MHCWLVARSKYLSYKLQGQQSPQHIVVFSHVTNLLHCKVKSCCCYKQICDHSHAVQSTPENAQLRKIHTTQTISVKHFIIFVLFMYTLYSVYTCIRCINVTAFSKVPLGEVTLKTILLLLVQLPWDLLIKAYLWSEGSIALKIHMGYSGKWFMHPFLFHDKRVKTGLTSIWKRLSLQPRPGSNAIYCSSDLLWILVSHW